MAGALRYELIGDASQFVQASRETIDAAERMEGSMQALEQNLETLTEGQLRYNEAADRFRNQSGQFVSGAEAQAAALQELNSEGVQTTEQIKQQVQRLEELEQVYQGDARAAADLSNEQQRLRTQLAEVGVATAQQNRDLSRLDQTFEESTVAMTDFASRQARLQAELRSTAAAQDRVTQSGVTMRSSASAAANNLSFELVSALQDLQFGAAGAANQIPLISEQATQLRDRTGSASAAISQLKSSIIGPVGLIAAGTLLVQNWDAVSAAFQKSAEEAKGATKQYRSAADELIRLQDLESPEALTSDEARARRDRLQQAIQRLQERQRILGTSGPGGSLVGEQAEELARVTGRLDRYGTQLERINELLTKREERLQLIRDAQGDLLRTPELVSVEDQVIEPENIQFDEELDGLFTQTGENIRDAKDAASSLRSEITQLAGPQGVALAQARRTRDAYRGGVEALRNANRIIARREDGIRARQIQGALPTASQGAPPLLQSIQELSGQANVLDQFMSKFEEAAVSAEALRRATEEVNDNIQEFEQQTSGASDSAQEAGDAVDNNINNQIARGIQLSAQLGATLVQSARQGGLSFQQAFSSILQTVGSVLALSGNPIAGAALSASGTFVGAFQEGGRVPRSGTVLLGEAGPELVNLPAGSTVHSNAETQEMMTPPRGGQVNVQVTGDIKRVGPGELGVVLREVDRYQSKHPPR